MLFDPDGLEMSTHESVAAYHASKFPDGAPVVDMTCGIGSDLIALARRGSATGYELDPRRAGYARHNLAVHGLTAEVVLGDGLDAGAEYAYCDPSRRVGARRVGLTEYSPNPAAVVERFRGLALGGIKLSPMLPDGELESFGGSIEFVSFGGECREALVWISRSPHPFSRRAVHVESAATLRAGPDPSRAAEPRALLFEADPAAIRAHCLGELAREFGLAALGDSNGYLTGERPIESPWLRGYEVLAWHPADLKRTKAELKRLSGGTPVVKCRGARIDVDGLRRQLRGEGEEFVVAIYPDGRSLKHIVCRPMARSA